MVQKKTSHPRIPEPMEMEIREVITGYSDGMLEYEIRGPFCYIYHARQPLCRLKYTGDNTKWDFAIYKFSTGKYSTNEFGFPRNDTAEACVKVALNAYDLM